MKKYSIVRMGSEYIVQAGETSILKVSSRREAAKLVTDAAGLLQQRADTCRRTSPHQSSVMPGSYLIPPKFLDDRARFP